MKNLKNIEKDIKPSEKDIKPSGKDIKPSEKDIKPSEKEIKPSGKDIKPSEKDIKPSEKDIKPSGKDIKPSEKEEKKVLLDKKDEKSFRNKIDVSGVDVNVSNETPFDETDLKPDNRKLDETKTLINKFVYNDAVVNPEISLIGIKTLDRINVFDVLKYKITASNLDFDKIKPSNYQEGQFLTSIFILVGKIKAIGFSKYDNRLCLFKTVKNYSRVNEIDNFCLFYLNDNNYRRLIDLNNGVSLIKDSYFYLVLNFANGQKFLNVYLVKKPEIIAYLDGLNENKKPDLKDADKRYLNDAEKTSYSLIDETDEKPDVL